MAKRFSYRDYSHPSAQDALKTNNSNNVKLIKTAADFSQAVASAHREFSERLESIVASCKVKLHEIRAKRPLDCHDSLCTAFEALLQETHAETQRYAETADMIDRSVREPLVETATHKKIQLKKICAFRDSMETFIAKSDDEVAESQQCYIAAHQAYKTHMTGLEASRYLTMYYSAHNEYLSRIQASNAYREEYHQFVLPSILEELEEINIDIANVLNSAIESYTLLSSTKNGEANGRFEGVLKACRLVNPKSDIHNYLATVQVDQKTHDFTPHVFTPVSDSNSLTAELTMLKYEIVNDKLTETELREKRLQLQQEAAELTSYIKQNQDITQSLMSVCQRNVSGHHYSKFYEVQDDLCRKRNEIRLANVQLAGIRAQIELITPRDSSYPEYGKDRPKKRKSFVRAMWKRAFKSLVGKEKEDDAASSIVPTVMSTEKLALRPALKKPMRRMESREQLLENNEPITTGDVPVDPIYVLLKSAAIADARKALQGSVTSLLKAAGSDVSQLRSETRSSTPSSGTGGSQCAKQRRVHFQESKTRSHSLELAIQQALASDHNHAGGQLIAGFKKTQDQQGSHHLRQRSFSLDDLPVAAKKALDSNNTSDTKEDDSKMAISNAHQGDSNSSSSVLPSNSPTKAPESSRFLPETVNNSSVEEQFNPCAWSPLSGRSNKAAERRNQLKQGRSHSLESSVDDRPNEACSSSSQAVKTNIDKRLKWQHEGRSHSADSPCEPMPDARHANKEPQDGGHSSTACTTNRLDNQSSDSIARSSGFGSGSMLTVQTAGTGNGSGTIYRRQLPALDQVLKMGRNKDRKKAWIQEREKSYSLDVPAAEKSENVNANSSSLHKRHVSDNSLEQHYTNNEKQMVRFARSQKTYDFSGGKGLTLPIGGQQGKDAKLQQQQQQYQQTQRVQRPQMKLLQLGNGGDGGEGKLGAKNKRLQWQQSELRKSPICSDSGHFFAGGLGAEAVDVHDIVQQGLVPSPISNSNNSVNDYRPKINRYSAVNMKPVENVDPKLTVIPRPVRSANSASRRRDFISQQSQSMELVHDYADVKAKQQDEVYVHGALRENHQSGTKEVKHIATVSTESTRNQASRRSQFCSQRSMSYEVSTKSRQRQMHGQQKDAMLEEAIQEESGIALYRSIVGKDGRRRISDSVVPLKTDIATNNRSYRQISPNRTSDQPNKADNNNLPPRKLPDIGQKHRSPGRSSNQGSPNRSPKQYEILPSSREQLYEPAKSQRESSHFFPREEERRGSAATNSSNRRQRFQQQKSQSCETPFGPIQLQDTAYLRNQLDRLRQPYITEHLIGDMNNITGACDMTLKGDVKTSFVSSGDNLQMNGPFLSATSDNRRRLRPQERRQCFQQQRSQSCDVIIPNENTPARRKLPPRPGEANLFNETYPLESTLINARDKNIPSVVPDSKYPIPQEQTRLFGGVSNIAAAISKAVAMTSISNTTPAEEESRIERARSPRAKVPGRSAAQPTLKHKRLQMRMKSFSLDTSQQNPEPVSISSSSRLKSNSAGTCTNVAEENFPFISFDSDSTPICPENNKYDSGTCRFVALYNYRSRETDDTDLIAGKDVVVTDVSDPDWWKGYCEDKLGYFPAMYVTEMKPTERPLRVISGVEISRDGGIGSVKLLKDQIVIMEGEREGMIMIRIAGNGRYPCPRRYLAEISS